MIEKTKVAIEIIEKKQRIQLILNSNNLSIDENSSKRVITTLKRNIINKHKVVYNPLLVLFYI